MRKTGSKNYTKPLGERAYAAIAKVEGLCLTEAGRKRLQKTKGLSAEKRRDEVLRAYKPAKPTRK